MSDVGMKLGQLNEIRSKTDVVNHSGGVHYVLIWLLVKLSLVKCI